MPVTLMSMPWDAPVLFLVSRSMYPARAAASSEMWTPPSPVVIPASRISTTGSVMSASMSKRRAGAEAAPAVLA